MPGVVNVSWHTRQCRFGDFVNDNGVSIDLLKEWLKVLEDAIYRMRVDQFIFQKVFDVIDRTKELQKRPSHFFAWMRDNYIERMANIEVKKPQSATA